jgi:hypothetical protein
MNPASSLELERELARDYSGTFILICFAKGMIPGGLDFLSHYSYFDLEFNDKCSFFSTLKVAECVPVN